MGDAGQRRVADALPAEFRRGGLAEHDCARILQAGDEGRVHVMHIALQRERAALGRQHGGLGQVLDGDSQACQRPHCLAFDDLGFQRPGGFHRAVAIQHDKGVQRRLKLFDPAQYRLAHLNRRDLFGADKRSEFAGGQKTEVIGRHGRAPSG